MIPSKIALSLFSVFAFLEGHADISRIVLTFASDVRLQIGRRTYTCSELLRVRTLAEFEGREHVRGRNDPRKKNITKRFPTLYVEDAILLLPYKSKTQYKIKSLQYFFYLTDNSEHKDYLGNRF